MIKSLMQEQGNWDNRVPYHVKATVGIDMAQERLADTVTVEVTLPRSTVEQEPGAAIELIGVCGLGKAREVVEASREIATEGLAGVDVTRP